MRLIRVLRSHPLATIQDPGRRGFQSWGVPVGGPMDPGAFRLASRAVGNAGAEAGIETAGAVLTLRAEGDLRACVSGAEAEARLGDRLVPWHRAFDWPSGATLAIAPPRRGVWSVLAVAGGIETPTVLGSRSTSPGAGIGRALADGDALPVGIPSGAPEATLPYPWDGEGAPLRISWTGAPVPALVETAWTVGRECSRTGYRLEGPPLPPPHPPARSLPTLAGAVQVTPAGQPLVLLADRPATGGYPVVAVVHPEDLGALAQRRTGEALRFRA